MSSAIRRFPSVITKKKHRYGLVRDVLRNPWSYVLIAPALIYVLLYGYLTLPYLVIAFQRYSPRRGIVGSEWVWFQNFVFFFRTAALQVTWNTIKLNALFIMFTTAIALVLSLLLNELRTRFVVRVTQSIYILPHFISWIIVSYMVYALFATENGLMNQLIVGLGGKPVRWYSTPGAWTWILVSLRTWKGTGINTVIYLAAITAIDQQLYEAAIIDGASRLQRVMRITVPLLLPTVTILSLLAIGRIFYGDFALIYAIIRDNGVLYETTDVIDTYVFRALRQTGTPSQAMAVGLYQSVMGFVFVYGTNRLVRRFFREGALF